MIQIDLPMPEACDVCPFNYDFCWCKAFKDDEFDKYSDDWNDNVCERTTRPEYCPLKEQPQIVRCKDCRHCTFSDGEQLADCMIKQGWFPVKPDWFCADGERR